ncbi:MAG: 3-methyladenine DNA glycosylase, partial [Ectopseudomonas oleovorans]
MPATPSSNLPWPDARPLPDSFFDRDAQLLARELLGK